MHILSTSFDMNDQSLRSLNIGLITGVKVPIIGPLSLEWRETESDIQDCNTYCC